MANELTLIRGDTTTYQVVINDSGSAFDLTGYTCYFTVKKNKNDSNDNAIIGPITGSITGAITGEVEFALSTTNTAINSGTYYYDVEITDGANTFTVINSTIIVTLDVKK